MSQPTTKAQRLAELERELGMKKKHYPDWVRDGKLSEATSAHRIRCFEEALADLRKLYEVPTQAALFGPEVARATRSASRPDKPRTAWD